MVVDDEAIVREGLCELINTEGDLEVVAMASDGQELLDTVNQIQPDIILFDLSPAGADGLAVLESIQQMNLGGKVILFTASGQNEVFVEAMKRGCLGIVSKETPPHLIMEAIRKVNEGEVWLDSGATAAVLGQFPGSAPGGLWPGKKTKRRVLSKRERQIMELVTQGLRNRDIADKLIISEQTVKNHMHSIFEKTGVLDRLELALYAVYNHPPRGD
jgi:DNA-binding NarL/FixJ family response regulator